MSERAETQERVPPRISLVLCAGQDLIWAGQSAIELGRHPGVVAEAVMVAAGPAPADTPFHWIQVEPGASLATMQAAGFAAVDDTDVIWFEHRPDEIDWTQLTTLATVGVAPLRKAVDWVDRLRQFGVADPGEQPRDG